MVRAGRKCLLIGGVMCTALLMTWQLHHSLHLDENGIVLSSLNRGAEMLDADNTCSSIGVISWLDEQQSRKNQVGKACQTFWKEQHLLEIRKLSQSRQSKKIWKPPTPKEDLTRLSRSRKALSYLYVDDVYKFIYCNVPKVSSTQWKKVMIVLSGSKYNSTDDISYQTAHFRNNLTTLLKKAYSPEDVLFRLKTYSKILTIRDPLERLLSAYQDKFAEDAALSKNYHNMFGRHWIPVVRKNKNHTGILQFDEFLEYLSRHSGPAWKFNGHWRPIFDLCHPCTIQYDFIVNFTTQEQDSNELLARVLQGSQKSGLRFPEVKRSSTADRLKEILPTLDHELVKDVQKKYYKDYDMFGNRRFT